MKVTAFIGSARKMHTFKAAEEFLKNLQQFGDVDYEIVSLSDHELQLCRGCKLCFDRGEEMCLLKDARDTLIRKIEESDGIVFATPNYAFQVSGLMKLFLDRLAFIFHRPRFFGKVFTSIVVQGIYGGNAIVKYLNMTAGAMGFETVNGSCLNSLEPASEKTLQKNALKLMRQSRRFYERLSGRHFLKPSFAALALFRASRTALRLSLDAAFRDFTYYNEKGWFDSDYYYPVNLDPLRKSAGFIIDFLVTTSLKKRVAEK